MSLKDFLKCTGSPNDQTNEEETLKLILYSSSEGLLPTGFWHLQYKMVAHFTPKAKSRQATMILSQTLPLWGWTCLFTQLTLVSPCATVFLVHLSPPKKCVCVCHTHQNGKVNPFELAVQLATEWKTSMSGETDTLPFSSRRASRGKSSTNTMDRDGLLLSLSAMGYFFSSL